MKNVLVSIFMITYNHEKYIAQALESILMQKVDFEYEIIIGDDYSTDKTRDILKSYKERYPERIKLILRDKNIGVTNNVIEVYKNCTGKYIAMLEGDDYWTDKNKLQIQVDFLEDNIEYSGCFHNTKIYNCTNGKFFGVYPPEYVESINNIGEGIEEIIGHNCSIHISSLVFRNFLIKDLEKCMEVLKASEVVGDVQLFFLNLYYGKLKGINRYMSVYRYKSCSTAATTKGDEFFVNEYMKIIDKLNIFTNKVYNEDFLRVKEFRKNLLINTQKAKVNNYDLINLIIGDLLEKDKSKIIKYIKKNNNSFGIYGFGTCGKLVYKLLKNEGLVPNFIVDKNEKYQDEFIKVENNIVKINDNSVILLSIPTNTEEIKNFIVNNTKNKVVTIEELISE